MAMQQRRGRRIAMDKAELDEFLTKERTCRVATVSPRGPHVTPLWFVWDGAALWLTSLVRSQRWTDMERDPRVAVIVDAGEDYGELRGAELRGKVEAVGEVPRTGQPCAELEAPERLIADKYFGGQMHHDGRHAWLKLVPEKITSWDFRKILWARCPMWVAGIPRDLNLLAGSVGAERCDTQEMRTATFRRMPCVTL